MEMSRKVDWSARAVRAFTGDGVSAVLVWASGVDQCDEGKPGTRKQTGRQTEAERQRDRERERETARERETDRQTDTETERERERDRQKDK